MSEETPSPLQRILVALDASPHSQAALDAAVRLAMAFEAEVKGLFVKDEALLRAAQLPFAEEVRAYTTSPKGLTDQRMQRQLRYQAESRHLSAFAGKGGGLVILPAGCAPLSHMPLRQFLCEIDRPLLVMR